MWRYPSGVTRNERHVVARSESRANDLATNCRRWMGKRSASDITRRKISMIRKSEAPLAQMAARRPARGRRLMPLNGTGLAALCIFHGRVNRGRISYAAFRMGTVENSATRWSRA
jgi:hypothetical protein